MEPTQPLSAPQSVSFAQALRFWLKLGLVSFGGPAGQIAIMHSELVDRRRWISEARFLHALNYCMLLPGPEAQQLATYIGWLMHRTWGGIVAGGLFVLPSLFILIALSWIYMRWGEQPIIAGLLYGIKPAVVAIVLAAAWRIGQRALKHPALWLISAAAFIGLHFLQLPFPLIIFVAALVGAIGGKFFPMVFSTSSSHSAGQHTHSPALIDDHTPTPPHAQFRFARFIQLLCAGLALWAVAMGGCVALWGWQGTLSQMAWFFTKAALLTFGGAYAVLPYVYQGAVEQFHWLTAAQMMDGLALGETTPGPLIMIVAFVGFVGGWGQALFGAEHVFLAAAFAASIATFFTFLPSFIFILVGGPLIESTHGQLRFTAPLTGITAAVVGVIVSLGVLFAMHLFWPQGVAMRIDLVAMIGATLALIAIVRFKLGLMRLIGACALIGLALRGLGLA